MIPRQQRVVHLCDLERARQRLREHWTSLGLGARFRGSIARGTNERMVARGMAERRERGTNERGDRMLLVWGWDSRRRTRPFLDHRRDKDSKFEFVATGSTWPLHSRFLSSHSPRESNLDVARRLRSRHDRLNCCARSGPAHLLPVGQIRGHG